MSRRTWTLPELRAVVAAVEAGQTWDEAAKPYGVTGHAARVRCAKQGLRPDLSKRPRREHPRADLVLQAIRCRNVDGLSWSLVAQAVGWPSSPEALRQAVYRYTARHGGKARQGRADTCRTKWGTLAHSAPR